MPQGRTDIDKAWFTNQMKEKGLSVRSMASRMNIHSSALSRTLNGERRMQVDEIRRIAEILDRPLSEIWAHLGSSTGRQNAGDAGRRSGFMEDKVDFKSAPDMSGKSEDYVVAPRGADPLFGCMAGTLTLLPDVDYTAPADTDWGKVYDD
ncbi:XRE family transcriptional regulator [Mesorhizobium sp. M4A.F.Ca.ET.022.05.2.1]|uniref:helix-turn-helix domain-containing protein n=1 Tax=Mesorhizobium sp. M4A.F.Ca.ET.022.05.2.1 TaxID=2496653 RepID=UPI000FCCBEF7|nr:helix-turn-helix transcriptional regulator [Mesorhizobium sp. M4A.F.Ca.ET.022.05.2.1]RVC76168.1 XRE family transcriptional regulator [Mesorhizobium sp. M4A.F.Ca.ET.022.05.2.1]